MAEGRVAQVVGEAHRGDDDFDVGLAVLKFRVFCEQFLNSPSSDRTSHAGHFKAVGQAVVDHLASRKGKHLGLVLQSPECAGEDDAVIVALKRAADVGTLVRRGVTMGREKVVPVHKLVFVMQKYYFCRRFDRK